MKRLLRLLIALTIMCAAATQAWVLYAEAAGASVQTGWISVWRDGVSAVTTRRDNVTVVTLTAPESSREYFYPYLYRHGDFDLTGYGAYAYRVRSIGSTPLKINFTLTDHADRDYRVEASDSVVVTRDGDPIIERLFPAAGLLELEAGFAGEVHIPIDGMPAASLRSIVSYGVTVAVPAGGSVSFELSDARWTPAISDVPEFNLNGPAELRIPALGESAARYTVDSGGGEELHSAVFTLISEAGGVSITDDGMLTVTDGAKPDTVRIGVTVNGRFMSAAPLTLLEKRRDFPFPNPEEASAAKNDPLYSPEALNGFRIAFVVASIYPAGLYLLWKTAERGSDE